MQLYPRPEEIWIDPLELSSSNPHILFDGISGSGKSVGAGGYVVGLVGQRKILDLNDSGRFENLCYCLEETDRRLLKIAQDYSPEKLEAKEYPVEYFMALGKGIEFDYNLPNNITLVAFDEMDVRLGDISELFQATELLKVALENLEYNYGDNITLSTIENIAKNAELFDRGTRTRILSRISRLRHCGLFSSNLDDRVKRLDFSKILRDEDTITSFSSFLLDEESYEKLFYGLILKKLWTLIKKRRIEIPVTLYIREIADFVGQYSTGLATRILLEIVRRGRDYDFQLVCDSQRATDIHPKFRRQFGTVVQMRADMQDAEKNLEKIPIPREQLEKIPFMEVGTGLLISGAEWNYPVKFRPTLYRHKKEGMPVLNIIGEKYGTTNYSDLYKKMFFAERKEPKEPEMITTRKIGTKTEQLKEYNKKNQGCRNIDLINAGASHQTVAKYKRRGEEEGWLEVKRRRYYVKQKEN